MLGLANPQQAYRKVELDALVLGSSGIGLVDLCFERALSALGRALIPGGASFTNRSRALSDALLALTALRQGVDEMAPLGATLIEFYSTAIDAVSAAILRFDPASLTALKTDLADIHAALKASGG